jgi:hypothetical protein
VKRGFKLELEMTNCGQTPLFPFVHFIFSVFYKHVFIGV